MSPNPPKIDWVPCPICGEPDMEREPDDDGFIITCTNLVCASNGGDNRAALKCEAAPFTNRMAREALELRSASRAANAIIDQQADEMKALQSKLDDMAEWKDAAYQTISDLRDAAYGKGWSGGKTQDETIGQIQRLKAHFDETTSIAYHLQCAKENGIALAQLAAAKDIADLIRPRVKDEVKNGRGHMTTFDRHRMEALAKALAAFDGETL